MNRDKVLELAREAGLVDQWQTPGEKHDILKKLERFAPLVECEVRGGMSQDKVFELMLTAGCSKYCDPKHPELEGFIVNDFVLERIVALIEREVRGDAEPVAWMGVDIEGNPNKFRLNFFSGGIPLFASREDMELIETTEKNGSPCPEFWDWLPRAYNFNGDGAFTKYNMEVAFLAGKNSSPAPAADAEPVACIATNGALMWLKRPEALYSKPVPLFMHPAPAVVRQLVEALEKAVEWDSHDAEGVKAVWLDEAQAALAAAKEAGL